MPHLLNVWPRVSRQIAQARHVLLLLDYDGTLAPIAARPELATLPERTRQALVDLIRRESFTLGIVSGRALSDVAQMVALPGLIYAGNHGLEIKGTAIDFTHPAAAAVRPEIDAIRRELASSLAACEGVLVEGKGLTLSLHYRLTPAELRPRVFAEFDRVVRNPEYAAQLRVTRGKELLEVRPNVDWDKGKAITRLAAHCPEGTLAIFCGDDLTDEDGFAAVHELGGLSVFVGPARQPTRALYRVDSPLEVAETLELLARL